MTTACSRMDSRPRAGVALHQRLLRRRPAAGDATVAAVGGQRPRVLAVEQVGHQALVDDPLAQRARRAPARPPRSGRTCCGPSSRRSTGTAPRRRRRRPSGSRRCASARGSGRRSSAPGSARSRRRRRAAACRRRARSGRSSAPARAGADQRLDQRHVGQGVDLDDHPRRLARRRPPRPPAPSSASICLCSVNGACSIACSVPRPAQAGELLEHRVGVGGQLGVGA